MFVAGAIACWRVAVADPEGMNYEVVGSSTVYDGKILKIQTDEIRYMESGRKSRREVVVKDDFAMVVPVAPDGSLVAVRQFRHPFQQMAISFPAGRIDPGEDPAQAARRELEEEAGLTANRLVKLAVLHEVPEFARSVGHLFLAEGLSPVPTRREEGEATMSTLRLPVDELRHMVREGEIKSVTVIAALHHFLEHRSALIGYGSRAGALHVGSLVAATALASGALLWWRRWKGAV